jgi:hypothetical protein
MKKEEPEELKVYREWLDEIIANGPPRYCYNCIHYDRRLGQCDKFDMKPPVEFTQTANQCDDWFMEPPF